MKYIFTGKVLPERAGVNLPNVIFGGVHNEIGLSFSAELSINYSQIAAEIEIHKGDIDIFTLMNIVQASIGSIVDAFGYIHGIGYDIEIISAVDEKANQTVFGVGVPGLEARKMERPLDLDAILRNFKNSQFLATALSDLRESIRSAHTGYFCYRAVECIRQHFYKPEDKRETDPSWKRLREALKIDREWIDEIGKYALPQRHGEEKFISGEEREKIMQHAWKVVDRFCIYLDKGSRSLDEKEYPILTR